MENASRSSVVIKWVGLTLVAEALLFLLAYLICLAAGLLTGKGFFSILFILGLVAVLGAALSGGLLIPLPWDRASGLPAGSHPNAPRVGIPSLYLYTATAAGVLAVVLGLVLPAFV